MNLSFPGKEVWYDWGGANEWLFQQINAIHGDTYDAAMILLSRIADRHNFPYYIGGLAVFALLSFMVRKLASQGGAYHILVAWVGVFLLLGAGFVANYVIIGVMKDYFAYPRPYIALGNVRVLELRDASDNFHSFPSGHVAFITMMVVGLWPVLSKNMKWLGAAVIFGVCWSRIALGVHFPADVVASFLIFLPLMVVVRALIYWILLRLFGLRC